MALCARFRPDFGTGRQVPHPDWTPKERWPQEMSSYAVDDGARLLLFDPLSVPMSSSSSRPTASRWWCSARRGERDTKSLVELLGTPVFVPPPDTPDDLVRKYGITPEQAAGASPDVAWLLPGDGGEAHLYAAGDRASNRHRGPPREGVNDLVLWIESVGAVIPGDTLVDFGRGMEINEWLRGGVTRAQVFEGLRPLLALPVEFVLPTQEAPTDRGALERAFA